ncbi:YceI family protein [Wenyingzhuangia sp. chi5]|uniref:YceI family protein n=1 Tax=Wenyingzhuangia gilva TaxID=3057677 RepID=A0ABT8VUD8_9FLAO|nr:YceI family protein [Wenyingzhuangia sp. chi5]MDO3695530.1 YceI family protein [Wenyingzhuangia sp. chi5]
MYKKSKILVMSLLFGLCIGVYGQEYKVQKEGSNIKVLGTSTVHDWHEDVEKFSSTLTIKNTELFEISALELKVIAESLESGKSLMNKLTYEALKTDKHPNILFSLLHQEKVSKVKDGVYNVELKGNLSIAGVKKEIKIKVEIIQMASEIILKGSKTIKMTDFGMEPPKAMFGTIKTGDEVTIEFKTIYKN